MADAIPRDGRIIALADAFDAMTSYRPYRPALSLEESLQQIRRGDGTQFDPQVVRAFRQAYDGGLLVPNGEAQ